MDPKIEKLFAVSNQEIRLHCGEFTAAEIRAAKAVLAYVRSRMAGRRIVEDVPVAWRHLGPRLSHGYHYRGDALPDSLAAEWQPLYAAPSDTEVGNG